MADSQATLTWAKTGVVITSLDGRYNGIQFIPWSNIAALKFMDAFPGELLL